MVQLCPSCKRTVSETDENCPHCGANLSQTTKCPFCKLEISDLATECPHCGKLLIYEHPKEVTKKRNVVLFPLGLLLLFTAVIYGYLSWQGIIESGNILSFGFIVLWLIGFALFGAYMGKGDTDFWWGK